MEGFGVKRIVLARIYGRLKHRDDLRMNGIVMAKPGAFSSRIKVITLQKGV
jgi:hypothetical protein